MEVTAYKDVAGNLHKTKEEASERNRFIKIKRLVDRLAPDDGDMRYINRCNHDIASFIQSHLNELIRELPKI